MSLSKFAQLAHKIAKENKAFYDVFTEFEDTKRMQTKIRMNFTIDKVLSQKFKQYCRKNHYSMSGKIEEAIEKMMK